MQIPRSQYRLIIIGIIVGALYGILFRSAIQIPGVRNLFLVMSIAFIFATPFVMGFLSVFLVERKQRLKIWLWLLLPWVTVLAGLAASAALLLEGWICIVMFAPIALLQASIGGIVGGAVARSLRSERSKNISTACVVLLPLLLAPWEQRVFTRNDLRVQESVIDIQASPAVVWSNIERVPPIHHDELLPSWSHTIGFPNPIEATLSAPGTGGIRHATFEHGVLFIETIDVWEPQQRLAFSIHAQTAKISSTTLDEHVTVGGQFFDVLRGEYRLEPLPNGATRLHLSSQHRVSTDFNWYAHLWTDAVMADLQNSILHVIKNRCEANKQQMHGQ